MYIQPYEPQEMPLGSSPLTGYAPQTCAPEQAPFQGDGVSSMMPWSSSMPGVGDAVSALNDAPLGMGLGGVLSNLTGMMQQLVQMMQSLLGRMGSEFGGSGMERGRYGGCTQGPIRRFPLDPEQRL
ncbi:MAG TPA: hypothetical protein VMV82_03365 [Candidatus Dormibacteraeota bacterium]|nr:hypothetical protein [Candidatus Dormibacteraeota bacterium]